MLQCVAVCSSVLQCVALRCSVVQGVAVCCSVFQSALRSCCAVQSHLSHEKVIVKILPGTIALANSKIDSLEPLKE